MAQLPIDQAKPIRAGEELDVAALDAYLARTLPQYTGTLTIEQFPSGFSNLTYLVRKGDQELVLRRPPFAAQVKSGHDMGREYRVLSALCPVYPVPKPLALCSDDSILGAPFYLMERRQGLILRGRLPPALVGQPELLATMCERLIDTLARLHAIDYGAIGLADLGRPEGYVQRQVEGWIQRWNRAKTDEMDHAVQIGKWLLAQVPETSGAALVHNDYKFDNVILDPEDPTRITTVLDWEMCTVGDPWMDLGTLLGYWVEEGDDPVRKAMAASPTMAPGALTRRNLVDYYGKVTGRDVSNMVYYYCFALFKIAVIAQQIFARYHKGATSDPRFAALHKVVAALLRDAVEATRTGRY